MEELGTLATTQEKLNKAANAIEDMRQGYQRLVNERKEFRDRMCGPIEESVRGINQQIETLEAKKQAIENELVVTRRLQQKKTDDIRTIESSIVSDLQRRWTQEVEYLLARLEGTLLPSSALCTGPTIVVVPAAEVPAAAVQVLPDNLLAPAPINDHSTNTTYTPGPYNPFAEEEEEEDRSSAASAHPAYILRNRKGSQAAKRTRRTMKVRPPSAPPSPSSSGRRNTKAKEASRPHAAIPTPLIFPSQVGWQQPCAVPTLDCADLIPPMTDYSRSCPTWWRSLRSFFTDVGVISSEAFSLHDSVTV